MTQSTEPVQEYVINRLSSLPAEKLTPRLAGQVRRLTDKLDKAYPGGDITGFRAQHKKWGEAASRLARQLGFENSDAFLEACGYTAVRNRGGRPSNDHSALIEELRRRYPDGTKVANLAQISRENPDLAGRLKTLRNNCTGLLGMSLWNYLVESGIVIGEKSEPHRRMTQDEKNELPRQAELMLEELKRRYADAPAQMSVSSFRKANENVDWPLLTRYRQRCTCYGSMEEMLIAEGILQKPMDSHEAMDCIVQKLRERLASKPFEGSFAQLVRAYPDLPFKQAASLPVKQHLERMGMLQKPVPSIPVPLVADHRDTPAVWMPKVEWPDSLVCTDRYFVLLVDNGRWREYRDALRRRGGIVRFAIGYLDDYIIIPDEGITEGYMKRLEVVREYWPSVILMTESHFRSLLEKDACR